MQQPLLQQEFIELKKEFESNPNFHSTFNYSW